MEFFFPLNLNFSSERRLSFNIHIASSCRNYLWELWAILSLLSFMISCGLELFRPQSWFQKKNILWRGLKIDFDEVAVSNLSRRQQKVYLKSHRTMLYACVKLKTLCEKLLIKLDILHLLQAIKIFQPSTWTFLDYSSSTDIPLTTSLTFLIPIDSIRQVNKWLLSSNVKYLWAFIRCEHLEESVFEFSWRGCCISLAHDTAATP